MIANRTLFVADNLRVMRGMDSESVDLIATDPPFNTKLQFNAPLGSKASKAKFDDRWRWDDVTDEWHDLIAADHPAIKELIEAAVAIEGGKVDPKTGKVDTGKNNSVAAFVAWMAPRIAEMERVLKPTGTIYLHCDPTASHYLKLLMDAVFGVGNYLNEISWLRTVPKNDYVQGAVNWPRTRDVLLHYRASARYDGFNQPMRPLSSENADKQYRLRDPNGRRYQLTSLTAPGAGTRGHPTYELMGVTRHWRYGEDKMNSLVEAGRVVQTAPGRVPRYKRYLDESKGVAVGDSWTDIHQVQGQSKERTGWPTQKPLALYERIVRASSNEGDLVLDPFCGCATTCVAAERLGRKWIGIDIDPVAEGVTADRLRKETGLFRFADGNPVAVRKNPPKRTDIQNVSDAKLRLTLWNNQGRRCANPYCDSGELREVDIHLDHRIPKSRGGEDGATNRIGLCQNCNGRKSAKAWGTFLDEEQAKQPHPKVGKA